MTRRLLAGVLGAMGVAGLLVGVGVGLAWLTEPGWEPITPRLFLAPFVVALSAVPVLAAVGVWRDRSWGWGLGFLLACAALALALANQPGSAERDPAAWLPALLNGTIGSTLMVLVVAHRVAGRGAAGR